MSLTPYQARLLRSLAEPGRDLRFAHGGYNLHTPDSVIQRVAIRTVALLSSWLVVTNDPDRPWTKAYALRPGAKERIERFRPKAFESPATPKPEMRAHEILRLLQQRFVAPRHFLGVNFSVGIDVADAVAFHLNHPYRSTAFEIKVTRSDFLRERNDARKNWNLRRLVDGFIYVCPAGMVTKDEVQPSDGLMYAWRDRLRIVKQPSLTLQVIAAPHVSRVLAASLLRRHGRDAREAINLVQTLGILIERVAKEHPEALASYWRGDPVKDLIRRAGNIVRVAVADGAIDPRAMRV